MSTAGRGPSPIRWRVTAFLGLAAAVNFADRSAFNAVLAPLQAELHLSNVRLGLLASLFLWSYALASPLAGNLADRFSRSAMVAWSLAFWSVCTLLTGVAGGLAFLCLLRIGLGLGESIFSPAAFALVADHHGPATRGRAMSLLSLAFQAGIVAGAGGAGYLAEHYGWRSGFYVLGLGGVALSFATRWFVADRSPERARAPARASAAQAFRYLATVPCFYVMMLKQLLSEMGTWVLLTWLPLLLYETYHLKLGAAGFTGTIMLSGALVLGMALGGWLFDWVGRRRPGQRMLVLGLYYLAAAPFPLVFLLQPSFSTVVVAVSLCSLIRGMATAAERPLLCEFIPAGFRSTVFGCYNGIANVGGAAGVFVTGWVKSGFGLSGVFAALAAVYFVAALALWIGHRFFLARDVLRSQAFAEITA
jgi:predicted MFS family arabinose efflux permease